ncbi:MAG: helix-hairpin-helix domain-containing protein, partial [Patescibacteria group bacterium]
MTNLDLAQLLRKMAAAYQMLDENRFKIIAYERAADSIELLTREVKDYWNDGKLSDIPSVGEGIAYYLDELFRSGHVKHFDEVIQRIPEAVFPLLLIPGIGPKKAYRLVKEFGFGSAKTVVSELERAAKDGKIASMEGFGDKSEDVILSSIALYNKGAIKENRMELPVADRIAQEVITYLKKLKEIETIDVLGSLRRQVATIGDIDIAVATTKPEIVVAHFLTYPHEKIIDKGTQG